MSIKRKEDRKEYQDIRLYRIPLFRVAVVSGFLKFYEQWNIEY